MKTSGLLPFLLTPTVEYFVQVVDESGNVAISDNKGQYFMFVPYKYYLPVVFKGD
jgi:hypothetical protein